MKSPVFTGAATALITPFDESGIDYNALARLIDWQIESGINALVVCGTTGESSTLTDAEHKRAFEFTVKQVNGRVPVIAGTGSNDAAYALELTDFSCKAGVDGVLVVTPSYNKATQNGLFRLFTAIADKSSSPVILYNVPSRTGVKLPISVIKKLSEVSNIEAIKEASGDISYTADIASEVPNLDLYSGNDDMVTPILALGGKGVISVTSNIVPRENHDMVMNYLNGNIKEAIKTQIHFIDLIRAMFIEVNPVPIKYAMNIIGFEVGDCRSPLGPLSEKNKEHVKEIIKKYGVKK